MKNARKITKRQVLVLILLLFTMNWTVGCGKTEFINDPEAIERASKSVVELTVYNRQNEVVGTGSGFFAFDGKTIVTNYHVIKSAYRIEMSDDNDNICDIDTIYNVNDDKDIAILLLGDKVAKKASYVPFLIADSKDLLRGESVVAIGSPLGIKNTISTGTISNFVEESGVNLIQFTAAISSGSSGGALLNNNGEIIGMTSASYIDGQNLNLAIPSDEIKSLYEQIPLNESVKDFYSRTYIPTINEGVLTVGVSADYHPYEYIDNYGDFAGIEIDILTKISEDLGLEVKFVDIRFHELFTTLRNGQVDCIIGGMEYTPERQEVALVSNKLFTIDDGYNAVIYVSKDNIELQMKINNSIYLNQKDGVFDEIVKKY